MSSLSALYALLSFTSLVQLTAAQNSVSLTPASKAPANASLPVDPSFAGFGIEPSNLFSFTGFDKPNPLSINLLQNLANYTGTPPHLRIGGNTQDNILYDETFTSFRLQRNPNPTVSSAAFPPDEFIAGPTYFQALDRFPAGTPITFGLNLADQSSDFETRINNTATAAVTQLKNVELRSFEIGNEVDLYLQNGFRTGQWDGQTYAKQWLDRAGTVYNNVLKPNKLPMNFFEPGCTASTIGTSFTINQLVTDGIINPPAGSQTPYIAQWNQHDYYYYIGVSKYTLTMDLFTDLSTTSDQFQAWEEQIGEATGTGYRFALREMGVVGPIGMNGITDTFAASLWTLHFFLYAATLNISSVQMHMTDNSNASAWQPVNFYGNAPFVRPNYYAFAAMAQIIGCGGGVQVGGPGVLATSAPAGYANRIASYSVYRDSALESMVFINSKIVDETAPNKPSVSFNLSLPDSAGKDIYLAYLTADGTTSAHNVTWNGISYEQNSIGLPEIVDDQTQTVRVGDDGSVSVPVRDSEALVVRLGGPFEQKKACPVNNQRPSSSGTSSASSPSTSSSSRSGSSQASNTDSATPQGTAPINSGLGSAQQRSAASRSTTMGWRRSEASGSGIMLLSACLMIAFGVFC